MSIERLRKIAFGAATEKTATVLPPAGGSRRAPRAATRPGASQARHGRHAAHHYTGARRVPVPHPTLRPGQPCPSWSAGHTARATQTGPGPAGPGTSRHHRASLRVRSVCVAILCGKTDTATLPARTGMEKYDLSVGCPWRAFVAAMAAACPLIAWLSYSTAWACLPASTQWELVEATAVWLQPVFVALPSGRRASALAAQRRHHHARERPCGGTSKKQPAGGRTGIFTTGIVAEAGPYHIALFFTGRQHAGENLDQLLRQTAARVCQPPSTCATDCPATNRRP